MFIKREKYRENLGTREWRNSNEKKQGKKSTTNFRSGGKNSKTWVASFLGILSRTGVPN